MTKETRMENSEDEKGSKVQGGHISSCRIRKHGENRWKRW